MYKCGWNGCEKAYGTLNHLNAHVTMQSHGTKRTPEGEPFQLLFILCASREYAAVNSIAILWPHCVQLTELTLPRVINCHAPDKAGEGSLF
jgi:hypothetical protein